MTGVWLLCWEDSLEKGMATYSSILAWRISWTEEPRGLQSTGSQRVGHIQHTCAVCQVGWFCTHYFILSLPRFKRGFLIVPWLWMDDSGSERVSGWQSFNQEAQLKFRSFKYWHIWPLLQEMLWRQGCFCSVENGLLFSQKEWVTIYIYILASPEVEEK